MLLVATVRDAEQSEGGVAEEHLVEVSGLCAVQNAEELFEHAHHHVCELLQVHIVVVRSARALLHRTHAAIAVAVATMFGLSFATEQLRQTSSFRTDTDQ